jgi:hypothetical protein
VVEAIEKLTGHPIPRIVIDGLDVVEWAESDGRRRGRGKAKPAPKKAEPKRAAIKADTTTSDGTVDEPRSDRPARGRGRKPAPVAAIDPGSAPQPHIDVPHRPEPALRPERGPRRDDRRDDRGRNRRDDDLGPSVLGFGDDVPAFMLVAARSRRPDTQDAHTEDVES